MTFLELCQRVRQESGISGSGPESVLNQKAILQKVVEWVRQADLDIQKLHSDWLFLWRMGNASIVQGITEYTGASLNLTGTMKELLVLEIDGYPLRKYTWKQFKAAQYQMGTDNGTPNCYTVRPDNVIVLSPKPSKDITATAEYSIATQSMIDDGDISIIPEEHHEAILQKALMYYASHEEDQSLYQVAYSRYEEALSLLADSQLPAMELGRGIY